MKDYVLHECPECASRYIASPGAEAPTCRPCPANGFPHEGLVTTRPIVGCEPPRRHFVAGLSTTYIAANWDQAVRMMRHSIDERYPKRQAETLKRNLFPVEIGPDR